MSKINKEFVGETPTFYFFLKNYLTLPLGYSLYCFLRGGKVCL